VLHAVVIRVVVLQIVVRQAVVLLVVVLHAVIVRVVVLQIVRCRATCRCKERELSITTNLGIKFIDGYEDWTGKG
jgi:hypothetical protein